MKTKRYYHCTVTTKEGRQFSNPLRLMEFNILRTMIAQNQQVIVTVKTMPVAQYNRTFNTQFPITEEK